MRPVHQPFRPTGQRLDIGFQWGIEFDVMGGVVADDIHHRGVCAPGVVQIRQPVGQSRTQVQQGGGGPAGDPGVTVGRTGGHPFEQAQHRAHLRAVIQCRNEMHLRGAGVGEAHRHPARQEPRHDGARPGRRHRRPVNGSCRRPE
jgi:hypothetical protein